MTGAAVELLEDNSLENVTASTIPSWDSAAGVHTVRYNNRGPTVSPYLIARELELILLQHEARQADAFRQVTVRFPSECGAQEEILEDHVRALRRDGVPENDARHGIIHVVNVLLPKAVLTPLDVLVEQRLHGRLPELRASQTLGFCLRHSQNTNPLFRADVLRWIPSRIRSLVEVAGAAYALFVDEMLQGRTTYAATFAKSPSLTLARELAGDWKTQAKRPSPGIAYELIRQFVEATRVSNWVHVAPVSVKSAARQAQG